MVIYKLILNITKRTQISKAQWAKDNLNPKHTRLLEPGPGGTFSKYKLPKTAKYLTNYSKWVDELEST